MSNQVLKQLAAVQARHSAAAPAPEQNQSKRSSVIAMMERPEGATRAGDYGHDRMAKTYSIRIPESSATPNGRLILASTKARDAAERRYRIVPAVDHR